jgi:hypothetical protein
MPSNTEDYSAEFYAAYARYLKEPEVRKAHNFIFSLAWSLRVFREVIDLGCGQSQELLNYGQAPRYVGIDRNVTENYSFCHLIRPGDYRQIESWRDIAEKCRLKAFVSLFSSEITAPYRTNYKFYSRIFAETNLKAGLVSGFYYGKRKGQNPVREAGGVVSYQTLESIEAAERVSVGFTEKRIIMPVPSKMFGPDVVEVWKIFERKQ